MIDVSWGETFVILGISIAAIGRKDLPKASRFFGNKVGRVVGLLQGARARADRFAQKNELNALQNELRSGLRELDSVKGELAIAASSQGLVGRGLGSTIPSSRKVLQGQNTPSSLTSGTSSSRVPQNISTSPPQLENLKKYSKNGMDEHVISGTDYLEAARLSSETSEETHVSPLNLAPRSHSVAAVAEEEWEKRGIGFKTKAERGTGFWDSPGPNSASSNGSAQVIGGGSLLLSNLIQQNLIHDQYDRVVMEQDLEMKEKMDRAEAKARNKAKKT